MRALLYTLCLALLSFAATAETTLKIATLYPPGSAPVKTLQQLSTRLKTETDGEVVLKIYPGGVMGDDDTVLRKMRIGQLHGAMVSAATLDTITPDLKDISQLFQFETIDEVYQRRLSIDGVFRQRLANEGWRSYGPFDGGFSYLMSKEPILSLAELRQSKLWLPNTRDIQALSKQMDVNYLVMNIGDVLTGLDTGAIDSLIAPPSAALTLNWHSRFNYYVNSPVIYTWGMLILPERVMARLPAAHRETVDQLLTGWSQELEVTVREGNKQAAAAIAQLLTAQDFNSDDLFSMRQQLQ